MNAYPNDPSLIWNDTYWRCGMVVGAVIFCIAVLVTWRAAIRAWGPFAGLMLGVVPAILVGGLLAAVGLFTWPVWLLAPIALWLARSPRARAGP